MTILRETIATRTKGPMAENEDWWYLCYDTELKHFFIEHEWSHVQINGLKQDGGTSQHDVETWSGEGVARIQEARKKLLELASS